MTQPDFSNVGSAAEAQRLAAEGFLVKVFLFPVELGGQDDPRNIIYVPPAIAEVQRQLIGTLERFVAEGVINKMTVEPDYRGSSFVPIRIRYNATHSQKPGEFNPTIEIW